MLPAITAALLPVIDPADGGPLRGRKCNVYADEVTPAGIDAWLSAEGFSKHVRWPEPALIADDDGAKPPEKQASEQDTAGVADWKMQIQIKAAELMTTLRGVGASPTVHSILPKLVEWCRENQVKTSSGIFPSEGYLRTHVLGGKHWTPPR